MLRPGLGRRSGLAQWVEFPASQVSISGRRRRGPSRASLVGSGHLTIVSRGLAPVSHPPNYYLPGTRSRFTAPFQIPFRSVFARADSLLGEVRRHFRDHAWVMYVPRRIKDTRQRVGAAMGPLAQRLGRAPMATEVAAELGLNRGEVVQSVNATNAYQPSSLDAPGSGSDGSEPVVARQGVEDSRYASVEDALTVAALVTTLSERERLILRLRFCENMPQTQIGRRLGVSHVQVSRLLAATLERLRQSCREQSAQMGIAGG